jgi:FtsH-binding integral membrane protein
MSQRHTDSVITRPETLNAFMRGVYLWMSAGLAVTALLAYFTITAFSLLELAQHRYVLFGLMIAQLILVFAISAAINRMSAFVATALFLLYSALNGVTIAPLLLIYTRESVFQAFLTAAGMFGAMSVYGMVTKRDLTGMGSFMMMGLFGILIAMLVNMFVQSSAFSLGISILGVFIFLGLTAYDTQNLRNMGESAPADDAAAVQRGTILGALKLYLDFINIFIFLLRIMGDRR